MAVDDLLTIAELATMLGVTVQRAHQLITRYDVPTVLVNARMKLVRLKDAESLLTMERPSGVHVERRVSRVETAEKPQKRKVGRPAKKK